MRIKMLNSEKLRIIGIYLIIILSLLIFVISPLSNSLKGKKEVLNEYLEAYETKNVFAQRRRQVNETVNKKSVSEEEKEFIASLYPKDSLVSEIQIETFKTIRKSVEKNDLDVVNFRFFENVARNDLGEVSIIVNIKGMPKAIIGLLKDINEMKMLTDIKNLQITGSKKQFTVQLTLTNYLIES